MSEFTYRGMPLPADFDPRVWTDDEKSYNGFVTGWANYLQGVDDALDASYIPILAGFPRPEDTDEGQGNPPTDDYRYYQNGYMVRRYSGEFGDLILADDPEDVWEQTDSVRESRMEHPLGYTRIDYADLPDHAKDPASAPVKDTSEGPRDSVPGTYTELTDGEGDVWFELPGHLAGRYALWTSWETRKEAGEFFATRPGIASTYEEVQEYGGIIAERERTGDTR